MLKEIERKKPVAEKVADQSVSCVVMTAENTFVFKLDISMMDRTKNLKQTCGLLHIAQAPVIEIQIKIA